jgi:exonuclease III
LGEGCGHLWTHRNGKTQNAAVQNIDYVFISEALGEVLTGAGGGDFTFPEIWEYSDHAPVVVDFSDDVE